MPAKKDGYGVTISKSLIDMTFSPLSFTLILLGAVLLTALLVYLWYRLQSVPKKQHSLLQESQTQWRIQTENLRMQFDRAVSDLDTLKQELDEARDKGNSSHSALMEAGQRVLFLEEALGRERQLAESLKKETDQLRGQLIQLNRDLSVLKAELDHARERFQSQQSDFENLRDQSLLQFKEAANTLLEEKSRRFTQVNQEKIEQILKPLGENLAEFRKKVEDSATQGTIQTISLEKRIKELVELNHRISEEANNLTKALKGQAKTQGDWGEMILENILEFSGLSRNREYFVQDSFRDEEGTLKKPDVIVKYPDQRFIVIDSKVSLNAYERMSKAEQGPVYELELANHLKSIRTHIDQLSAREYEKFDKTLDFVMLFVPIEPAYMVAMQHDTELWNYAYTRRILLISPTNLIAALKMVADIWKRDDQNKNAREIAKRGEILYDKFVSFVEDLENIEKHLVKADESYQSAINKLSTGRGNLIGQAEKLKKLGIKSKKALPEALRPEDEEE